LFWFVTQLIDGYPSDPQVKELVDKYDWYLLPVVNPDGYSYTWSSVRENSLVPSLKSSRVSL